MSDAETELRPATPVAAWLPGALGVIPFAVSAGLFAFGPERWAGPALLTLLTYSAVILSFLGGIRWGMELGQNPHRPSMPLLFASTVPALAGWAILAAPGGVTPDFQIAALMICLLFQWLWDTQSPNLPGWYPRLRTFLTLGAVVSLAVGLEQAWAL